MYQVSEENSEGTSRVVERAGSNCHLRQVCPANAGTDSKEIQVRTQTQIVDPAEIRKNEIQVLRKKVYQQK